MLDISNAVNFRKIWDFINAVWAQSLVAVVLFVVGLMIGEINAESRLVADCKFAGAFRVDIQAFICQRKI